MEGEKKNKLQKKWNGDIAIGDWFSFTNYLKIHAIDGNKITVKNQRGIYWEITNDLLQNYDSATHYEKIE